MAQFKLFDTRPKKEAEWPKNVRWDKRETFWIGRVQSTQKDHLCARCEKMIPPNSRVDVTVDLDGNKPDFKTAKYWHPDKRCLNI